MNALIFTGGAYGNPQFYNKFLQENDFNTVLCADSGTNMASQLGIIPDLMVGDFDSIDADVMAKMVANQVPMLRHPVRKNETDTELAVSWCIKENFSSVTILGALGTRFDHAFGNIHLLNRLHQEQISATIIDEHNQLFLVTTEIHLALPVGTTVSVMAYTDTAAGIWLDGFEYPVDDGQMDHLSPGYGISNVCAAPQQVIRVTSGTLLVDVTDE